MWSHLFSWLRLICYTNQWSIPTLSMLGSHPTPSNMNIKLKLSHLCNSKRENKNRPSPDYLVRQVAWPALLLGQPRVELRTEKCQKTYNLFNWTSVQWIIDVGSPFSTLPWPAQDRVFRWTGRSFPLGQPPSWRGMWRLLEPEAEGPVWWTLWELLGVSRPKGKERNKPGRIGGIWRNLWLLYPITCSTWPLHQLPVTLSGELKVGANQP